jgi:uncharacterized C2H2 Zn-finger protein
MTEERKQWLKAVEEFRKNSEAIIECPNCKKGTLFFTDVAFDNSEINQGGERIIECPNCQKYEAVLYRNPPKNWYLKYSNINNQRR